MNRTRKVLLGILGVLILVGIYTYTVGGGLKMVRWEIQRRVNLREARSHEGEPFLLPWPSGPEKAPVRITVYVNAHSRCQSDKVNHLAEVMKPYKDRIRLVFRDLHSPGSRHDLAGYAVGCEMLVLINGLQSVTVPWSRRPFQLEGPLGENMKPEDYLKLIDWALTDAGQKSLKDQRAKFEVERVRRAKVQAEMAAKSKGGGPGTGPMSGMGPGSGPPPQGPPMVPPVSAPAPAGGK
jgi:hypothetical protein